MSVDIELIARFYGAASSPLLITRSLVNHADYF